MSYVSYTEFRQQLAKFMDKAWENRAPLRVTRQNARTVVVLSEAECDSMAETVHLLRSPANAERLLRSIKHANAGKLKEKALAQD